MTSSSLTTASLGGLCPRCGNPTLFAGMVRFADRCRACQLDFTGFNVGDGPAAFLTFFVGGLVTALAIGVELAWEPPLWVHFILWLPLAAVAVIGSLRVAKAMLLILEFRRDAREAGTIDP